MERLIGKVAAVTGGAAGIGEAKCVSPRLGRQKRTCGCRSKIWRRRGLSFLGTPGIVG